MCRTFEDGIAYVGTDYLAHGLWDKYIKFETEHGTPSSIVDLYKRILECPLKELDRYYSRLVICLFMSIILINKTFNEGNTALSLGMNHTSNICKNRQNSDLSHRPVPLMP